MALCYNQNALSNRQSRLNPHPISHPILSGSSAGEGGLVTNSQPAPGSNNGQSRTEDPSLDVRPLEAILEEFKGQKGAVIPILQRIQDAYGYLPKEILKLTSKKTGIPMSQLYGVATFYAQFHLTRRGKHLIRICDGTACHVGGSEKTVQAIENAFGVQAGGTSPDYQYTLEIVYCVGSCGLAPVAVVDNKVYGKTKPDAFVRQLKKLE
jgi:NADH:ubiquinone oxidoreductase subunit E